MLNIGVEKFGKLGMGGAGEMYVVPWIDRTAPNVHSTSTDDRRGGTFGSELWFFRSGRDTVLVPRPRRP